MQLESLYPILSILGGGFGCILLFNSRSSHEISSSELFHCSLVLGSFLLIIPWTFIGIHPDGNYEVFNIEFISFSISFMNYAYLCNGILLLLSFYATLYLMRKFVNNLENLGITYFQSIGSLEIALISLLIFDYILIQFLLPIRGYEALNFYFPEADIYYYSGRIVETNFLSYTSIEKAPLNTLLYTFTKYITNSDAYQLFPIIFLFGIALLGYDLTTEIWGDKSKGQLVMLLILVLPIIYWTELYWVYNQDLLLCYFFSASFYFIWKGIHNHNQFTGKYFILGTFSGSLALLSNINAWPLFLIIFLVIPTQKRGKFFQISILSIFTIFLITRVSTNVFIGFGFVILFYAAVILYHIVRRPTINSNISKSRIFFYFIASVILGGFWIIDRIYKLNNFLDDLLNFYFTISNSLKWEYNDIREFTMDITLESVHNVNFWSISLLIFLGLGFCLPWIIFKIISLIQIDEASPFAIWVLTYFMIWITFYSSENIGYISPIYIPLAMLIVNGFYTFIKFFNIPVKMRLPRIVLVLVGVLSFYFLIPIDLFINGSSSLDLLRLAHSQSAYYYYSKPKSQILNTLIFALIWIVFAIVVSKVLKRLKTWETDQFEDEDQINISKEEEVLYESLVHFKDFSSQSRSNKSQKIIMNVLLGISNKLNNGIIILLLMVIIMTPVGQQTLVLLRSNDIDKFNETMIFQYDDDYQAIIDQSFEHDNFYGAFLTVKTPGLQYFTQHPVLDFYYQSNLLGSDFFESSNLSHLVYILKNPAEFIKPPFDYELPFQFIVVPNQQNINFDIYQIKIWSNSVLFQSLTNTTYFNFIYQNYKFLMFEIV